MHIHVHVYTQWLLRDVFVCAIVWIVGLGDILHSYSGNANRVIGYILNGTAVLWRHVDIQYTLLLFYVAIDSNLLDWQRLAGRCRERPPERKK